jgi:hypothetical protein
MRTIGIAVAAAFLASLLTLSQAAQPARADAPDLQPVETAGAARVSSSAGQPPRFMPSSFHQHLRPLAGEFDGVTLYLPGPVGESRESKARFQRRWILNGLFLAEEYEGQLFKRPFSSFGLIGYDIGRKTYVAAWCDTMDSSLDMFTGEASDDGKVITFKCTYDDPVSRELRIMKYIFRIESDDRHMIELFNVLPDGTEIKVLETTCTRKPGTRREDADPVEPDAAAAK